MPNNLHNIIQHKTTNKQPLTKNPTNLLLLTPADPHIHPPPIPVLHRPQNPLHPPALVPKTPPKIPILQPLILPIFNSIPVHLTNNRIQEPSMCYQILHMQFE